MAQLLLVDPSAWSRWVKDETKVPPHVIKALQWYLLLEQKDPAFQQWREMIFKREPDPAFDRWRRGIEDKIDRLPATMPGPSPVTDQIRERLNELQRENAKLAGEVESRLIMGIGWKLILLLNTGVLIYWALKSLF